MSKWIAIWCLISGLAQPRAYAAQPDTEPAKKEFLIRGKPATKLEALQSLIREPGVEVTRCQRVELSDKATIRVVKSVKK